MCNRYNSVIRGPEQLSMFDVRWVSPWISEVEPTVYPTQPGAVLRPRDGGLAFEVLQFGVVPKWIRFSERAKHRGFTNARSEKIADAKTWRDSFRERRCVVPATSFIEFPRPAGKPVAHEVARADGQLVLFPAIWDRWTTSDGELEGYAIVTTDPHPSLRWLHPKEPPRIAVLLDPSAVDLWMNPDTPVAELQALLVTPEPETIVARPAI